MESIILIKGNVKFTITLDPGVWIFDERRKDLDVFLKGIDDNTESEEDYAKRVSKRWEREFTEGSVRPPTLVSDVTFDNKNQISGTYCIPLKPFLKNAEPENDAQKLIIETQNEEIIVPLETGREILLGFAKDGKPLREDGPVHCYFADGSNKDNPIKKVKAFRVQ